MQAKAYEPLLRGGLDDWFLKSILLAHKNALTASYIVSSR